MAPVAHVGHWAVNLLYVAPLVVAVGVLGYQSLKDRRRRGAGGGARRRPPDPTPPERAPEP